MANNNYQNDEKQQDVAVTDFVKSCFEWVDSLVLSLIIMVLLFTFGFRYLTVKGQSMENTLFDGEKLIGRVFAYKPKNGDIVAVGPFPALNDHVIIKRVIATEGQTLDINFDTGEITVDGVVLDEPYIKEITRLREGGEIPKVIPKDFIFVMGDNRNNSTDSRSLSVGAFHKDKVIAKAFFSINRLKKIY